MRKLILLLVLCGGCKSCEEEALDSCENGAPDRFGYCNYPSRLVIRAGAAVCECPGKVVPVMGDK